MPQLLVLEDRTVLSTLTVLNNADSGAGSLRDTIAAAQSGDTIVFDPSLANETITLTSGPLALTSKLTINGLRADLLAISGNNASQLFTLSSSAQVTLVGLTLTGGQSSQGGAVFIGGTATLTLHSDILSGNQAVGDAHGDAIGGAIYNSAGASLTIDKTVFVNDQTNGTNESLGGAIGNAGTATISDSQFIGNSAIGSGLGAAASGGAVQNGQSMTITNCLFTGNSAMGGPMADGVHTFGKAGGGAILTGGAPGVILTISNSIVAGNEAISGSGGRSFGGPRDDFALGGGIDNAGGGALNVTGCTITGNQAIGGDSARAVGAAAFGGGIDNIGGSTLNLRDSTVSSNLCQAGAGANGYAGGVATGAGIGNDSTAIITNCTISMNECLGGAGGAGANGGDAMGAGIENGSYTFLWGIANPSSLSISNCAIFGNMAEGGTNDSIAVGGDGLGGGIFVGSGTATLKGALVSGNQAQGGAHSQGSATGNGLGGGVYVDPSAHVTANTATLIAGNQASKSDNDVWGTISIVP